MSSTQIKDSATRRDRHFHNQLNDKAVTSAFAPVGGIGAAGNFLAYPVGIHSQGKQPFVASDGTNSTPVVTETYVTSMFVPCNMKITGVNLFNGSDVTGNVFVYLSDSKTGIPITGAASAATAGAGTDAYQKVPFATPFQAKGPAVYLVCVQYSSATARYNTHLIGSDPVIVETGTVFGTASTISPLPSAFVASVGNIMSLY